MRIFLSNDKKYTANLVYMYLKQILLDSKIKVIINEEKVEGVVLDILYDSDSSPACYELVLDKESVRIPVTEDTKATLRRDTFTFETKYHNTLISLQN